MPALIGGFGNFLMPLMVGGPDMAKIKAHLGILYSNKVKASLLNSWSTSPELYTAMKSSSGRHYVAGTSFANDRFESYLAGLFEGDGHI